ncbi:DrmE family protein [Clostridium perfringens]
MFNNSVLEAFKRFKLYKDSNEIKFTNLEEQILRCTSHEEKGNYLFITPKDNDYFLLVSIIYNALKMSYYNIFESENDILDIIEVGDILKYNKLLCKLKDKNDKYLILEFKDGTFHLPIGFRYKLSKYNGDAKVLNKMQNKPLKTNKKTKNLLAEIMGINIDEICKVNKKSMLIIENKKRISELVNSLYIKVGNNEKVALTEIFPMAYYSSVDNVYNFKGNSNKEEPILKFTSKIYVADELCKKIRNINFILFLPKKINNDDLYDLKEVERKKNVNKVSSIISPLELERQVGNQYLHEDFIVSNIDIDVKTIIGINSFNEKQIEYYKNYTDKNIEVNVVKGKDINKLRKEINRICSILSNSFINDDEIIKFIISTRKITKRIVSVPIPLEDFDKIIKIEFQTETIKYLINEFEKIYSEILMRNITSENRNNIFRIYNLVKELYSKVNNENLKWNELKSIITYSNTKTVSIINDNSIVRYAIKKYIRERFTYKKNIEVSNISKNEKQKNIFDVTVFTGLLEDNMYNNYLRYNTKSVICLFYQFEKKIFEFLRKRYISFYRNITQEDKEVIQVGLNEEEIYTEEDVYREVELDNKLEELTTISYANHIISNADLQGTNECCKVLKFTDGKKAFITKQFNAYELNEDREEILVKKPNELSVGQVLVFVNDIERDIVDSTIKDLLNIERIREVYYVSYKHSKKWKKILKNYMELNKYTYNDLKKSLNTKCIYRTTATIRSWVVDSIVGPQEKEIYHALAEITGDRYFLDNYNDIYESCNIIRSFQIKVRKAIAKSLLKIQSRDENDEIDNIIIDNCSGGFNHVIKVEIAKIYDKKIEIPCYLTNTVLEE